MSQSLSEKLDSFLVLARKNIEAAVRLEDLTDLKVQFLGKKGQLTEILKLLGTLSPEERASVGKKANEVKDALTREFDAKEDALKKELVRQKLESEKIDVTLPGVWPSVGSRHPVTQTLDEAKDIFRRMGFDICDGPEIETDYYNFEALNIPADHPARDMQDTFYFPDGRLLRTHTSPVQIRVMESQKPPIAMVAPGVVYRCDSDQTHTPMFHQIEALVVDEGITMAHLKGVTREFLSKLFGAELNTRFRPSFFPFTEPSAEVDMSCVFCKGAGCRVCKGTGWLEIGGCGMVDPAVFRYVGIDAERYSGFAFGMGIERVTMLRHGINDLRLFFENDIRFLKQF
jgi:phenylalanyl-tRNA synthetase alpha chain